MGGTYLRLNQMDLARILHPNQRLEITLNRTSSDGSKLERISVPANILSLENGVIHLSLSEEGRAWFSLFRTGRAVTIHTGRTDGLFTFKSKILRREVKEGVRIVIESPKILASKERRGGPRVPLIVPVVYRVLSFRDKKLFHLADKIGTGESRDLSNGGITLLTNLQLPIGMNLLIEFPLEGESVSLVGVVRRVLSANQQDFAYAVGLQFLEAGPEHQELITRAIHKTGEIFKGGISL
jgi:c-di-GMP-binding flagellar brake protein YcgR